MINKKLTAWERLSIARSPQRPTSLDYIKLIFKDFCVKVFFFWKKVYYIFVCTYI